MDEELEPCPFCGCNDPELLQLWVLQQHGGWAVIGTEKIPNPLPHFQGYVKCAKCGLKGPIAASHSGAIDLWNNKTDMSQAVIK